MSEYRTVRLKIPILTVREAAGVPVEGPSDAEVVVRAFLDRERAPEDREIFGVVALNVRGRLIAVEIVSVGTATTALVHPREVFRGAIALGAVSLIVWHTHPSGDPTPSEEDRVVYDRLRKAGEVLGIPVVDGLVLARGGPSSSLASAT